MLNVFKNCLWTFCCVDTTLKLRRTMNLKILEIKNKFFVQTCNSESTVLCKSYKNCIFRLLEPSQKVPLINKHDNCKAFLRFKLKFFIFFYFVLVGGLALPPPDRK
jgi:hypothetical protein